MALPSTKSAPIWYTSGLPAHPLQRPTGHPPSEPPPTHVSQVAAERLLMRLGSEVGGEGVQDLPGLTAKPSGGYLLSEGAIVHLFGLEDGLDGGLGLVPDSLSGELGPQRPGWKVPLRSPSRSRSGCA